MDKVRHLFQEYFPPSLIFNKDLSEHQESCKNLDYREIINFLKDVDVEIEIIKTERDEYKKVCDNLQNKLIK